VQLGFALAATLPLAAYLCTLSGHSYWLDGGEFVAASINLDIAHPPGHPLSALYGKLWTLLPLGPLPFRVALGQAVAAALAAGLLYRACRTCVDAFGERSQVIAVPAALIGAWLPALSFAIWFQAVRPEVYALQGLVCMLAVDRLAVVQASEARDARPLYAAAFALGLGLTNHHLMAFFLFPALLWCAWTSARRARSVRPIAICALLGLLALSTYAYLPVRAAQQPPANFGAPLTFARFFWVVSSRVYARDFGDQNPQPLSERFADIGVALVENLHLAFVLAALAGLYLAWRERTSRRVGWLWLIIALTVLGVRPWLGPVRGNPDSLGYLFCGIAAVGALVSFAAAGLATLVQVRVQGNRLPSALLCACAVLAVALQVSRHGRNADLFDFSATDVIDEYRLRQLPQRTALIAATPQTVFRFLELAASEAVRPDLVLVPLPFLRYPGMPSTLMKRHPQVRVLVNDFLALDRLRSGPLVHLARRGPVMTELESHLASDSYRVLLPAGLLYAVVRPRAARDFLPRAATLQRHVYARIASGLGRQIGETETARQLLWLRYTDALYYAAIGRPDRAREALAAAELLQPRDAHVRSLRRALLAQQGAFDVQPFFAFDAP
jgi:hypothetical protein